MCEFIYLPPLWFVLVSFLMLNLLMCSENLICMFTLNGKYFHCFMFLVCGLWSDFVMCSFPTKVL